MFLFPDTISHISLLHVICNTINMYLWYLCFFYLKTCNLNDKPYAWRDKSHDIAYFRNFFRVSTVLSNYMDNRIGKKKVWSGLYQWAYCDDWNIFNYICTQCNAFNCHFDRMNVQPITVQAQYWNDTITGTRVKKKIRK